MHLLFSRKADARDEAGAQIDEALVEFRELRIGVEHFNSLGEYKAKKFTLSPVALVRCAPGLLVL